MRQHTAVIALFLLGGAFVLGLLALAWMLGPGVSQADDATMHNCPQPSRWAIAVWGGDDGTAAEQAFATCDEGGVAAAYSIDPQTQAWSRWFPDRADISTLVQVKTYDQLFVLMSRAGTWVQEASAVSQDSLDLVEGWNSVCYTGQPKAVENATTGIDGTFAVLYMLADDQTWIKYVPGRPDLTDITDLKTYDSVLVLVTSQGDAQWVFDP